MGLLVLTAHRLGQLFFDEVVTSRRGGGIEWCMGAEEQDAIAIDALSNPEISLTFLGVLQREEELLMGEVEQISR